MRLGRARGPEGNGARGGQAGPRTRARGRCERAAGSRAVRIPHEPGGRRPHAPDRTGLFPFRTIWPTAGTGSSSVRRLAAAATRMEVTDAVFARNHPGLRPRQCVFHALLLGHISADDLRESTDLWALVTASGSPSAGASPARMVEYVHPWRGLGDGRHDAGPRDCDLRHRRIAPGRPLGGGDNARLGHIRDEALPGGRERGARAGRTPGRAAGGARFPDRGIALARPRCFASRWC